MADKKKAGVSVVPEFVAGEQPTADKFNSISVQLERASSELEKSVGDVWGESWPYITATNTKLTLPYGRDYTDHGAVLGSSDSFLDIANLARIVGSAANLNPVLTEYFNEIALDNVYVVSSEVLQTTGADEKKEFWLRFPPNNTISVTFSGTGAPTNRVASHNDVASAGDWHLSEDRKLTVFTPVSNVDDFTISYETVPVSWGTGPDVPGSTYNVIPDPNQTANTGTQCTASVTADGYLITLPTAENHRRNDNGSNTQLNGPADISLSSQLTLPRVIIDNVPTGGIIPEGFVYLRDNVTGKLYNDAVYEYNNPMTLIVKNVELDTGHGFSIITVGSTITEAIHDLRFKWFRHSHDGTYGEAPIHVSSLAGILESKGDTGIYVTSQIANNWMPQYLHRDGYRADSTANDNNAMRGDLVLSADQYEGYPGSYLRDDYGSYGIYFGSRSGDAPHIKKYGSPSVSWINFHNPIGSTSIEAFESVSISSEVGDVNLGGGVYLSSRGGGSAEDYIDTSLTLYKNVGLGSQERIGNVDLSWSSMIMDGISAGPRRGDYSPTSDAWSINHDGVGSSSTRKYATSTASTRSDSEWKAAVVQFLHIALQNVEFQGYDQYGNVALSEPVVRYWYKSIPLPSYLSDSSIYPNTYTHPADNVLALNVMVKSPNNNNTPGEANAKWWTCGGPARWARGTSTTVTTKDGESIIANVNTDASGGGYIHIYINASGETPDAFGSGTDRKQDFHHGFPGATPTDTRMEIDVKITITVASPCGVGVTEVEELK